MCRNKRLRLGRHWGEDAILVEPHAVGATAVFSRLEARAANLGKVSSHSRVNCANWQVPCDVCSSDRQWQCAVVGLAAGGVAGHIGGEVVAAGDSLVEEERVSTRWGLADGMAAGAGTEDVEPCRVGALEVVEVGASCSSRSTSSVSELSPRRSAAYEREAHDVQARVTRTSSTYMRRVRIRAIRGLLGSGRLPVSGKLALATLVREHGLIWAVEGGALVDGGRNVVLSRRALSQCNAAAGAAQLCEEGVWWCGRCSGAGEVSQNTGKRAATSAAGGE